MKVGTLANIGLFIANIVLCLISVLVLATLIQERSTDIVRVTVPYEQVGPTAQALQGITHKVAYAYPVGRDANSTIPSTWRVVIDKRSESTDR